MLLIQTLTSENEFKNACCLGIEDIWVMNHICNPEAYVPGIVGETLVSNAKVKKEFVTSPQLFAQLFRFIFRFLSLKLQWISK